MEEQLFTGSSSINQSALEIQRKHFLASIRLSSEEKKAMADASEISRAQSAYEDAISLERERALRRNARRKSHQRKAKGLFGMFSQIHFFGVVADVNTGVGESWCSPLWECERWAATPSFLKAAKSDSSATEGSSSRDDERPASTTARSHHKHKSSSHKKRGSSRSASEETDSSDSSASSSCDLARADSKKWGHRKSYGHRLHHHHHRKSRVSRSSSLVPLPQPSPSTPATEAGTPQRLPVVPSPPPRSISAPAPLLATTSSILRGRSPATPSPRTNTKIICGRSPVPSQLGQQSPSCRSPAPPSMYSDVGGQHSAMGPPLTPLTRSRTPHLSPDSNMGKTSS